MTRLALFCTRLIEAGWLLVAVMVPLYFNIFTTRVFEPDKITLLRCITLIMLLAQGVLLIERRRSADARLPEPARPFWQVIRQDFLITAVIAYGAVYLLASLTSIDPAISLGGSYALRQGFYSLFSYLVVFGLIAVNMRQLSQVSRLVSVMALTGFPAALYGVLQASGQDPLLWGSDVTARVTSTMGNPIFLGAFMIMVLPLAIGRALGGRLPDATRQVDGAAFWRALVAIAGAIVLLALLLVANHSISRIWFTYPAVLAIVAGVLVWVHEQLRRAAAWQVAVLFGVVAGFQLLCLVLSQSRGPFIGFLVGLPVFALLWTWQTRNRAMFSGLVAALALLFVFLVFFNLPSSPLGVLRSVPYFGRFGQLGQFDTGTGRIRVLFWQGTRELVTTWPQVGLEPDRLQFLRPLLGYGPETMAYATTRVYQPELGQVGLRPDSVDRNHQDTLDHLVMTGLIGLVAYFVVLVAILLAGVRLVTTRVGARTRLMFVSFLGALAAHLIETQVGIAIAATLSYFWIIAGLIYASSRLIAEAEDKRVVAAEPSQQVARPKRSQQRTRIRRTVQTPSGLARVSWLTFAAVAGAGLMVALSVVALSYDSYDEFSKLMGFGFVGSWIGLVLLAWLLVRREKSPVVAISGGWQAYLAYLVLMLLVVGGIVENLNQLSADVYHAQGQLYDRAGRYADSVVAYQRAFKLAPEQDNYALFVGRSLLEIAKRARPGGPTLLLSQYDELARSLPRAQVAQLTREDLLSSALVSLRRARDLRPLNPIHYANLAWLNRYWGDQGDPAKLQEASRYYSQATQLSPRDAHLYGRWALTELARKDLNSAREKSQKAISLDPRIAPGHVIAGDIELSAEQQPAAWKRHQAALRLDPLALNDSRFESRVNSYLQAGMGSDLTESYGRLAQAFPGNTKVRDAYAYLLSRNGQPAEAAEQHRAIISQEPNNWMAHRNLALNYNDLGDLEQAIKYMSSALQHAPNDQKPGLQALVNDMRRRASSG